MSLIPTLDCPSSIIPGVRGMMTWLPVYTNKEINDINADSALPCPDIIPATIPHKAPNIPTAPNTANKEQTRDHERNQTNHEGIINTTRDHEGNHNGNPANYKTNTRKETLVNEGSQMTH